MLTAVRHCSRGRYRATTFYRAARCVSPRVAQPDDQDLRSPTRCPAKLAECVRVRPPPVSAFSAERFCRSASSGQVEDGEELCPTTERRSATWLASENEPELPYILGE